MGLTMQDMDAIFNGAGAVVDAAQNVVGAVSSGINQIQGALDNSRRNAPMPQNNQPFYGNNYQSVSYGYGYSEPTYMMPNMMYSMPMNTTAPFASMVSPGYSLSQNNVYPNYMNPAYPQQMPMNNSPSYYGFSDPGYGNLGGVNYNGGSFNNGGTRGGSFGWG